MSKRIEIDINTKADTSKAQKGIAEFVRQSTESIRRATEIGLFFAEASGIAIDQILQLQIEAGLRLIEVTAAGIAAVSATGLSGLLSGRIMLQIAAVGLMYAQIHALRRQKAETAQRLGYATSGLRAMTF